MKIMMNGRRSGVLGFFFISVKISNSLSSVLCFACVGGQWVIDSLKDLSVGSIFRGNLTATCQQRPQQLEQVFFALHKDPSQPAS